MKTAIVVTTINEPTEAMIKLRDGVLSSHRPLIVIGDSKSPPNYELDHALYFSIAAQKQTRFRFAEECPEKHYARKNIGYLIAMREGCEIIQETDDDNIPFDSFFASRSRDVEARLVGQEGWCNIYDYYSDEVIWPRGLPLTAVRRPVPELATLPLSEHDCPIQQGLADENPDVDAIYRLICRLPVEFQKTEDLVLDRGVWCPFNSQNTTWWRDAFPLMYLPYYCSFRMTDIWRSFVAQRLAWECGWKLLFHRSTVYQRRNEHDLMRDFSEEIPGYLQNDRIRATLEDLPLRSGPAEIGHNLVIAYNALIDLGVVGKAESKLLAHWLHDIDAISTARDP